MKGNQAGARVFIYLRFTSVGVLRESVLQRVPFGRIDELERLDIVQQTVDKTERHLHPEKQNNNNNK